MGGSFEVRSSRQTLVRLKKKKKVSPNVYLISQKPNLETLEQRLHILILTKLPNFNFVEWKISENVF